MKTSHKVAHGVEPAGQRQAAPRASSDAVRKVMVGNRKADTKPEIQLRSALHRSGLRFRKNYSFRVAGVRVTPDIVFTRARTAVFVDGCFWHGCSEHGNLPRTNTPYWEDKLRRNAQRDELVNRVLEEAGWQVVRIWEHEPLHDARERVLAAMRAHPGSE